MTKNNTLDMIAAHVVGKLNCYIKSKIKTRLSDHDPRIYLRTNEEFLPEIECLSITIGNNKWSYHSGDKLIEDDKCLASFDVYYCLRDIVSEIEEAGQILQRHRIDCGKLHKAIDQSKRWGMANNEYLDFVTSAEVILPYNHQFALDENPDPEIELNGMTFDANAVCALSEYLVSLEVAAIIVKVVKLLGETNE